MTGQGQQQREHQPPDGEGADISAGEYLAEDDRVATQGYCALPHQATAPQTRVRAEQVRRHHGASAEYDAG